jgi:lauroyl/myristoyl acyltransferase
MESSTTFTTSKRSPSFSYMALHSTSFGGVIFLVFFALLGWGSLYDFTKRVGLCIGITACHETACRNAQSFFGSNFTDSPWKSFLLTAI